MTRSIRWMLLSKRMRMVLLTRVTVAISPSILNWHQLHKENRELEAILWCTLPHETTLLPSMKQTKMELAAKS